MDVLRIAAFSDGNTGGNPAGVVIGEALPGAADMQRVAAEVGFSETAFAAPEGDAWRVRYFSPESEVPFCGHATIALGAALVGKFGDGTFKLTLNQADITVEGFRDGANFAAAPAMIERGRRAALAHLPQIRNAVRQLLTPGVP